MTAGAATAPTLAATGAGHTDPVPSGARRWSGWLVAAAMLVASQLLFWMMLTIAERSARPDNIWPDDVVMYELVDGAGNTLPARDGMRHAKRDGLNGFVDFPEVAADSARFSVLLPVSDKSVPLALFIDQREHVREVRINGITVQPDVPLAALQGPVSTEPAYFPLPMGMVQVGVNQLTITIRRPAQLVQLPLFAVGPADRLAGTYRWRNRLLVDLPLAGIAILTFTIALSFAVNWPQPDRARMRWMMLLMGSAGALTLLFSLLPSSPLPQRWQVLLLSVMHWVIALSAIQYVLHDTDVAGRARGWILRLTGVLAAPSAALGILAIVSDRSGAQSPSSALVLVTILSVALIFLGCAAWLCVATGWRHRNRWVERLVLAVCLTTFGVDRIGQFVDIGSPFDPSVPVTLYWSPIVGALLGMGMIFALARQAQEARQTVASANETLAARLAEQDRQLADSYAAQEQILQRQAQLEERQRIVRDMHDGIGGQLLGLMMQVRGGQMDRADVEQGLQSSIADLRLIVDSMDTAEEGLAEALRSFEHRARPQVTAAGFAFAFDLASDVALPDYGPRNSLQLLRIMQEALTNAIRHSGGDAITITIDRDGGDIAIAIADNGQGMDEAASAGRGLVNMATRATALGGSVRHVTGTGKGTRVEIRLPFAGPPH